MAGAGVGEAGRLREFRCEVVSPSHVRSYIHKLSPTWMPKYVLNKDNNGPRKVNEERLQGFNPMQRTTDN